MAIIRKVKTRCYSIMDNRVFEDPRISFKAKGILGLLLTKPDDWEVMLQYLVNAGPDGRTAVESALNELEEFGYIDRDEQARGDGGRFDSIHTYVYEEPKTGWVKAQVGTGVDFQQRTDPQVDTDVDSPSTEEPSTDNPSTDNPSAENLRRVKNELVIPQEVTTEELTTDGAREEPSRIFASKNAGVYFNYPDERLNFSCEALAFTMSEKFTEMSNNSIALFIGSLVERVRLDSDIEEAPYAVAAIADRLENRTWRVDYDLSEPIERPAAFVMGIARQVIENWERFEVWSGCARLPDLNEGWCWDDFVDTYTKVMKYS